MGLRNQYQHGISFFVIQVKSDLLSVNPTEVPPNRLPSESLVIQKLLHRTIAIFELDLFFFDDQIATEWSSCDFSAIETMA